MYIGQKVNKHFNSKTISAKGDHAERDLRDVVPHKPLVEMSETQEELQLLHTKDSTDLGVVHLDAPLLHDKAKE